MDERTSLSSAIGLALVFVACGGVAVDGDPSNQDENGIGTCNDCGDREDEASGGASSSSGAGGSSPPGTGGSTTPSDPSEPTPGPVEPVPSAGGIALRYGDFPPSSGSSGSTGSGGGMPIDPERIYISFGTRKPLCEAPFESGGCGHWKVAFGLPPELLKPGVLELADPRLNSYSSFSGPDRGSGDCYGGGGSFFDGTVEIVSVDDEKIVIRLADTSTYEFDANGEHTIDRCD